MQELPVKEPALWKADTQACVYPQFGTMILNVSKNEDCPTPRSSTTTIITPIDNTDLSPFQIIFGGIFILTLFLFSVYGLPKLGYRIRGKRFEKYK